MKNKSAKNKLKRIFGKECFIQKLKLREKYDVKKYTGESRKEIYERMKRMKKLTYHHILGVSEGGKTTLENGALLNEDNHMWLHSQPPYIQYRINKLLQEYKEKIIAQKNIKLRRINSSRYG